MNEILKESGELKFSVTGDKEDVLPVDYDYELVTASSRAEAISKELLSKKVIAVDTETTGLDTHSDKVVLTQINDGGKTYIFDMRQVNPETIREPLESKDILKIAQHVVFDYSMLNSNYNIKMKKVYCTSLAEQIINAGVTSESNLAFLVKKYLGFKLNKDQQRTFSELKDKPLNKRQIKYATDDAAVLFPIYREQVSRLKKESLVSTALLEFGCAPAVAMMQYNGVALDVNAWRSILKTAQHEKDVLESKIKLFFEPYVEQIDLFGNIGINIDSQQQMISWLNKAGISLSNTKYETLKVLQTDHEVLNNLLQYRKHQKILTSYGESLLEKIHYITSRFHPDIRQIGARSGRFSFADPNLQQIPKDNLYRNCFFARPGFKIITADYSQQELRIAASVSNDPVFIQFFLDNVEVHCRTAEFIYGIPWKEIDAARKDESSLYHKEYSKYREIAKAISFMILYGGSEFGLMNRIGCSEKEAADIFSRYFKPFPKLKGFLERVKRESISNSYAINVSGRKRYFRFPDSSSISEFKSAINKAERVSINHIIQSSAADIMKRALGKLYLKLVDRNDAFLLLSVHDEILVEAQDDIVDEIKEMVLDVMKESFFEYCPNVPIEVTASVQNFWTK